MYRVAVFVGSARPTSSNLKLAKALEKLAAGKLEFNYIQIDNLPFYDDALWNDPPAEVIRLKREITDADAVLFVTPEYNRSIPGLLKNAIDWGTRPRGQNSLAGKPSAMIGASTGAISTAVAQQHLRSILGFCQSPLMSAVEGYIQFRPGMFTDDGEVADDATADFLAGFMKEFHDFIDRLLRPGPVHERHAVPSPAGR